MASAISTLLLVRLMQQVRLSAHCRTYRVVTTRANPLARVAENVLDREFEAERPNARVGR